MKKVGDLFAELGFKADASDSVKRAFVENLVRSANESSRMSGAKAFVSNAPKNPETQAQKVAQASPAKETKRSQASKSSPDQLSFDFGADSPSSLVSHVSESKSQLRSS